MSTTTPYFAIVASVMLAVALACDQNKFQPPTAPPPGAPGSGLVRLELTAPAAIAPGESIQLTATAVKSDGSVETVSGSAIWLSSDPRVLAIAPRRTREGHCGWRSADQGLVRGVECNQPHVVLPAGTYRLNGTVTDSGIGVAGVTVTVIGGVGEGLSTITDGKGAYALYGLRDHVRLQANGAGYLNRLVEIEVDGHRTFDFQMTPERERTDLRGRYTLTVDRTSCPSSMVPTTRSYDATITQDGPRLMVALSGADFIVTAGRGNAFSGFIDAGNHLTFFIGDPSDYYNYGPYDVVERIDDATALIISGTVTAGLSSSGISGTLSGGVLAVQFEPFPRIHAFLPWDAYRFEMVRR